MRVLLSLLVLLLATSLALKSDVSEVDLSSAELDTLNKIESSDFGDEETSDVSGLTLARDDEEALEHMEGSEDTEGTESTESAEISEQAEGTESAEDTKKAKTKTKLRTSALSAKVRLRSGSTDTATALAANKGKSPVLFVRASLWDKNKLKWGFKNKMKDPPKIVVISSSNIDLIPKEAIGHTYILLKEPKRWPLINEALNPVGKKHSIRSSSGRRKVITVRIRRNRFVAFARFPNGYFNALPASVCQKIKKERVFSTRKLQARRVQENKRMFKATRLKGSASRSVQAQRKLHRHPRKRSSKNKNRNKNRNKNKNKKRNRNRNRKRNRNKNKNKSKAARKTKKQ